MNEVVETILRKTPLFASLTDKEMEALAGRVSKKCFERGALLFSEGEACRGLFLVASGKIRIFKLSPAGREQVLAVEGPGSSFAELPVFDGGNYPASASALENAEVLFISRKDFQNFCREHPDVALKVIAVVSWLESELRRFHRGISLALLLLAAIILIAEAVRHSAPRELLILGCLLVPVGIAETKLFAAFLTSQHST